MKRSVSVTTCERLKYFFNVGIRPDTLFVVIAINEIIHLDTFIVSSQGEVQLGGLVLVL